IDAGLADVESAQQLDGGCLAREPGVEVAVRLFRWRVPEQLGVDVDVVQLLGGCRERRTNDGQVVGDPAANCGVEGGADGRVATVEPGDGASARKRHGKAVRGIRNLDEG